MSWIDTITGVLGGGAAVEAIRCLRDRAKADAAAVKETERTGRFEIADRAAHNAALLARVEKLEAQKDDCENALLALTSDLNDARNEMRMLKNELESTREELLTAIQRAQQAEERAEQLVAQIEELRARPISNPPVASGD